MSSARCLLHGDYWPGNVIFEAGDADRARIAAVIDWEDCALGDALSDVACCRVELLCAHGPEVMDRFTEAYAARMGPLPSAPLAVWEAYVSAAALHSMHGWGLPAEDEARRRRDTLGFLEAAAAKLGV